MATTRTLAGISRIAQVGLIVENGTGLTNANSYTSLEEANAYLFNLQANKDVALVWDPLSDDEKRAALISATMYLDIRYRWYGSLWTESQSLHWPRTKNYDERGILIQAGTIPSILKGMEAILALYWTKEGTLYNTISELGPPKEVQTDGFKVVMNLDPKSGKGSLLEGKRFPEVELALKNLGEFKEDQWWNDKSTVTRDMELK